MVSCRRPGRVCLARAQCQGMSGGSGGRPCPLVGSNQNRPHLRALASTAARCSVEGGPRKKGPIWRAGIALGDWLIVTPGRSSRERYDKQMQWAGERKRAARRVVRSGIRWQWQCLEFSARPRSHRISSIPSHCGPGCATALIEQAHRLLPTHSSGLQLSQHV